MRPAHSTEILMVTSDLIKLSFGLISPHRITVLQEFRSMRRVGLFRVTLLITLEDYANLGCHLETSDLCQREVRLFKSVTRDRFWV